MRSAVVFLCLCATAVIAAPEHRSREFNGVTATFAILSSTIRPSQPLKVAFSLHNSSKRPVEFRYLDLLHHVEVLRRGGKHASVRLNAAGGELAASTISLKAGETARRVRDIPLDHDYDLAPGDYYLIFQYDLRLLPDSVMNVYRKKLHSEDRVIWDSRKYRFHVHR